MVTNKRIISDRNNTAYTVLQSIGFTHLLNDMMQSVIPAIDPLLKEKFGFTFVQIGIITLVFQLTSSLLQPFSGIFFGLMFRLGGLGSAFFGWVADKTSVQFVFQISTLLLLLGGVAGFLPNIEPRKGIQ